MRLSLSLPADGTPSAFSRKLRFREAFTLIELLIVVAILGILMALLSGGILRSVENGRRQRRATEAQSLHNGIVNFWHDYNRWPLDKSGGPPKTVYEEDNWKVFNQLAAPPPPAKNPHNPMGKTYLDEGSLSTTTGKDGKGGRITLSKKRGKTFSPTDQSAIVSYTRNAENDGYRPYRVTFDLTLSTVKVQYWDDRDDRDGRWRP